MTETYRFVSAVNKTQFRKQFHPQKRSILKTLFQLICNTVVNKHMNRTFLMHDDYLWLELKFVHNHLHRLLWCCQAAGTFHNQKQSTPHSLNHQRLVTRPRDFPKVYIRSKPFCLSFCFIFYLYQFLFFNDTFLKAKTGNRTKVSKTKPPTLFPHKTRLHYLFTGALVLNIVATKICFW